jgi:hypothetical protein
MKDDAKLRADLERHLEEALAVARDLGDSDVESLIETTLDVSRTGDLDGSAKH